MKKNITKLLLIILIFLNINLYSQDILILKNGDSIEVKIKEVMPELVKYKKFNNLDGPTYSEYKAVIKTIIYQNGDKDIFEGKRFVADIRPKQETKELLPSSRVFLKFKETEENKSVSSYDAIKMLDRYLNEMVHCEIVDSKKNADFIFELYLYKKLGAKRVAKIKVIHSLSNNLIYDTGWVNSKGSRSVIVKTIGEKIIGKYPDIGKL